MWNGYPGNLVVLKNEYWDTLEDTPALAIAEARTINDALKYPTKRDAQTARQPGSCPGAS